MASTQQTDNAVPPHSWKGLSPVERASKRKELMVSAAMEILASEGESGLSIRAIATKARLNTRYFYESFKTVDDLLGEAFDQLNEQLAIALLSNLDTDADNPALIRYGISTVLNFVSESKERAGLMFVEAQSNPTLIERRRRAQDLLIILVRQRPTTPQAARALAENLESETVNSMGPSEDVVGPMFAGAMTELVLAWLRGDIVGDSDQVAARAASRIERIFD